MRVSRREILPLAENAVRLALRDAVREAILEVSREEQVVETLEKLKLRGRQTHPDQVPFRRVASRVAARAEGRTPFQKLSDREAWEQFDSIRFARYARTT